MQRRSRSSSSTFSLGSGDIALDTLNEEGESGRKKFFTTDEEVRVRRKIDWHLMPLLSGLYMSNLGNARIAGIVTDLRLKEGQYDTLLTVFYVSYILFEWTTLLWKVFRPHRYAAVCVFSWGFIACLQAIIRNFSQLALLRFLLGITEAMYAGVPFFLSFFYREEELALRVGLFISAAPLATTFASSLAYFITSFRTSIASWRLLFLIEGFPSCCAAVLTWYLLPDSPGTAYFLTATEQRIARGRAVEEKGVRLADVGRGLCDAKNWIIAIMYFSCNVSFSSLPVFLPEIIREFGVEARTAQGLSAPPYAVAFFSVLFASYTSDRLFQRGYFVMGAAGVGCLGYILQLVDSVVVRYIGVYLSASGIFTAIAILIPWTINNAATQTGRGMSVAMMNLIGQMGPLVGTNLYTETDAPRYHRGMTVCAAFLGLVVLLSILLRWKLKREKARGLPRML